MELSTETIAELVRSALEVRDRAHAPYSNFAVGAAILSADGRTFAACNVENASYGLSVCAERNAVAAAVAGGARELVAIAIASGVSPPASPCGACRQVLAEFGDLTVILVNPEGESWRTSVLELLPDAFLPEHLDRR